jgi:crossover junction endodeoxyribonuclease RusA
VTVTIDLPLPPSVNRVWRVGPGGRVHKAPAYVAWARQAGWELAIQRPDHFPPGTAIAVTVRAGKARRGRDLDNLSKAICDILQTHQVVANDRDITDIRLTWDASIEPGRVQVQIREIARRAA